MEHNNKFRTIVYIDVEEFQPTSRRPLSSPDPLFRLVPSSPTMASTSCIGPLASPDWVPTSPGPVPSSPPYIPRSPESASGSTSPTNYYPTSPGPVPPSPPYIPRSPEWVAGSVSPENYLYYPTSPGPGPQSPAYAPSSPQWGSKGTSPTTYYPTSPGPVPPSPPYVPRSPEWWSTSPTSEPQSPAYTPTSPQAGSRSTSPVRYYPTSPGPVPPSPPYAPQSPQWVSTSPSPVPLSPSSPAITDPFNELERELDGSWGQGRFVYNQARSIVPEEEEQRQHGENETTTEPFPELSDWEEDERTEGKAEEDVQDVMVHEPAAAVPEEGEGELPDSGYYEQLDQEEKGDAESEAEEDAQVQEPVFSVPEESSSPLSNYLYSGLTYGHPSTPFPWRRSSPIPSTPSASPEELEISESEDLPDHEYYEQLDQETAAESLIRLEEERSVVENPYTAIAALNCEPAQSSPYASYPSSETDMHRGAKDEQFDSFSPFSTFSRSSAINNFACRVSQRLIGCVKVQKRVDRMMWNGLMQKKMVRIMEVCEKYAAADVLEGLKR